MTSLRYDKQVSLTLRQGRKKERNIQYVDKSESSL